MSTLSEVLPARKKSVSSCQTLEPLEQAYQVKNSSFLQEEIRHRDKLLMQLAQKTEQL